MDELLVWVDENDCEIGYGKKTETHVNGQLHRAFSLFIFNKEEQMLLIQQRALEKYHSGGLWTNSCCSHPRKGEPLRKAVIRRVYEELGILICEEHEGGKGLMEVGKFQYFKQFENCAEHEIDHVFVMEMNGRLKKLHPDPNEIENLKWISISELKDWMKKNPEEFTAWFPQALAIAEKTFELC